MTTRFYKDKKNLAPYLSKRGQIVLVFTLFLLISVLPLDLAEAPALSRFMGITATGSLAILALIYAQMLINWRALHDSGIAVLAELSATSGVPSQVIPLFVHIDNPQMWPLYAVATSFDISPQLKLDAPDERFVFDANARTSYTHYVRCLALGEASVRGIGLALSDAFGVFVLEFHVESRAHVDIIPRLPTTRSRPRLGDLNARLASHYLTRKRHSDLEIEYLRQYRPGDSARHIAWRASAKRRELVVFEHQTLPSPCELTLIVDASLSMRAPQQLGTQASPLGRCFAQWPLANDPDVRASLIYYDEDGAYAVCKSLKSMHFYRQSCQWLLGRLRWNAPAKVQGNAWQLGLQELWKDLRLYRRIDYRKQIGKDLVIDIEGMALWSRLKLAEKALSQGHRQVSEDWLNANNAQSISAMVQDRRLTPAHASMQYRFEGQCLGAWSLLAKTSVQNQAPQVVVWISHFASPISEDCIALIKKLKTRQNLEIRILSATLPHETLCVNPLKAKQQKEANLVHLESLATCQSLLLED